MDPISFKRLIKIPTKARPLRIKSIIDKCLRLNIIANIWNRDNLSLLWTFDPNISRIWLITVRIFLFAFRFFSDLNFANLILVWQHEWLTDEMVS